MTTVWDSVRAAAVTAGTAAMIASSKAKLRAEIALVDRSVDGRKRRFGVELYDATCDLSSTQDFYAIVESDDGRGGGGGGGGGANGHGHGHNHRGDVDPHAKYDGCDAYAIQTIALRGPLLRARREIAALECHCENHKRTLEAKQTKRASAFPIPASTASERALNAGKVAVMLGSEAVTRTDVAVKERLILEAKHVFGLELYDELVRLEERKGWLPPDRTIRSIYDACRRDIDDIVKKNQAKKEKLKQLAQGGGGGGGGNNRHASAHATDEGNDDGRGSTAIHKIKLSATTLSSADRYSAPNTHTQRQEPGASTRDVGGSGSKSTSKSSEFHSYQPSRLSSSHPSLSHQCHPVPPSAPPTPLPPPPPSFPPPPPPPPAAPLAFETSFASANTTTPTTNTTTDSEMSCAAPPEFFQSTFSSLSTSSSSSTPPRAFRANFGVGGAKKTSSPTNGNGGGARNRNGIANTGGGGGGNYIGANRFESATPSTRATQTTASIGVPRFQNQHDLLSFDFND